MATCSVDKGVGRGGVAGGARQANWQGGPIDQDTRTCRAGPTLRRLHICKGGKWGGGGDPPTVNGGSAGPQGLAQRTLSGMPCTRAVAAHCEGSTPTAEMFLNSATTLIVELSAAWMLALTAGTAACFSALAFPLVRHDSR